MPALGVTQQDATDIAAYLYTTRWWLTCLRPPAPARVKVC